jgi:hypothetical protein
MFVGTLIIVNAKILEMSVYKHDVYEMSFMNICFFFRRCRDSFTMMFRTSTEWRLWLPQVMID